MQDAKLLCEEKVTDEERMEKDQWQLADFNLLDACSKKRKKQFQQSQWKTTLLDFAAVKSEGFKEELKAFYRQILLSQQRSVVTLCAQKYLVCRIIGFMNQIDIKTTLIEHSYEAIYQGFKAYMEQGNISTIEIIHAVSKEQRRRIYVEDSDALNEVKRLYRFVENRQYEHWKEEEKDVWDVRKLSIAVEIQCSRPRYCINFTHITQQVFRQVAKKYVLERLKVRRLSCVFDDMKALNLFSAFLQEEYPGIDSLKNINRGVIEEYFAYVDEQGYAQTTQQQRKGFLRTFFELTFYLQLGEVPEAKLIFREDYRKKIRVIPRIISEDVLAQLNAHLDEVPAEAANLTLILEHIGMRVNEACQLKMDCLRRDSEGYPYLEYYQSKNRRYNRIPISEEVAGIIQRQMAITAGKYPQSEYVFAQDGKRPYAQENFSYHINRMAYRHSIMDESGTMFRFRSHLFRHTVATRYANAGMSPNMIRAMLGHKSLRSIMSYVEIRDIMVNKKLQEFIQLEDEHLAAWTASGCEAETQQKIPLANGYCRKGGDLCETALLCYSCGMFQMDQLDLENAEAYHRAIGQKLSNARYMGLEREIELYQNMESVLAKAIETKGKKYGKDRENH